MKREYVFVIIGIYILYCMFGGQVTTATEPITGKLISSRGKASGCPDLRFGL